MSEELNEESTTTEEGTEAKSEESGALKLQLCRQVEGSPDLTVVCGIDSADMRGHGGQVGFEDAHRTIAEVDEASPELLDLWTNPERLAEFVKEGDSLGTVVNRALYEFAIHQPEAFGHLASLGGLEGSGTVYVRGIAMDE